MKGAFFNLFDITDYAFLGSETELLSSRYFTWSKLNAIVKKQKSFSWRSLKKIMKPLARRAQHYTYHRMIEFFYQWSPLKSWLNSTDLGGSGERKRRDRRKRRKLWLEDIAYYQLPVIFSIFNISILFFIFML